MHVHPGAQLQQIERIAEVRARIEAYRQLGGAFPACAPIWFNLAQDLARAGQHGEARAAALRAVALDPAQRQLLPERIKALVGLRTVLDEPGPGRFVGHPGTGPVAGPTESTHFMQRAGVMAAAGAVQRKAVAPGDEIAGYRVLTELAISESQILLDAARIADGVPVTLRALPDMDPQTALGTLEAQRLSLEGVPGCAQTLDLVVASDGTPYQVLRRIRGSTFADLVLHGGLAPEGVAEIVHRVTLLLDHLHQLRLLHCDLRPDFVFREDNDLKRNILLLGLSRAVAAEGGAALPAADGRLGWMAPEEGTGARLDTRTDVYAVGQLLYFGLCRKTPPALDQRVTGPIALTQQDMSVAPPQVLAVMHRCLAPVPESRYGSVADVGRALAGAQMAKSLGTLSLGTTMGKWRLHRFLGEGTFGTVYEAVNSSAPDIRAAVKVLHPHMAVNPEVRKRFEAEVSAIGRISHENIVRVFDAQLDPSGACYLVTELLEGSTLGSVIAGGPIDWRRACRLGGQIAGALQAAHAKQIVHRDLKPDNIFLVQPDNGTETVKVLDFGIAKIFPHGTPGATAVPMLLGTPHYMSPEQWMLAHDVDGRADIYALGVILFQALSGRHPFDGATIGAIKAAHLSTPPPMLENAAIPERLRTLVHRMMSKDPRERPRNMAEISDALRLLVTAGAIPIVHPQRHVAISAPVEAPPAEPRPLPWWQTRSSMILAAATVAILGAVLIGLGASGSGSSTKQSGTTDAPPASASASAASQGWSPPYFDECKGDPPRRVTIAYITKPKGIPSPSEMRGWLGDIDPAEVDVYQIQRQRALQQTGVRRFIVVELSEDRWSGWQQLAGSARSATEICQRIGQFLAARQVGTPSANGYDFSAYHSTTHDIDRRMGSLLEMAGSRYSEILAFLANEY